MSELGERVARAYGWERDSFMDTRQLGPQPEWFDGDDTFYYAPDPENCGADFRALLEWFIETKGFWPLMDLVSRVAGGCRLWVPRPNMQFSAGNFCRAVTVAILEVVENE